MSEPTPAITHLLTCLAVLALAGTVGIVAIWINFEKERLRTVARRQMQTAPAIPRDPNLLRVPATGCEVFTAELLEGRVYEFTFSGVYSFVHDGLFSKTEYRPDARLYTDWRGNFLHPYVGVS